MRRKITASRAAPRRTAKKQLNGTVKTMRNKQRIRDRARTKR